MNSQADNELTLEVNVCGIIWNQQPSLAFIINDFSWHLKCMKMNQLNSYKDQLMAVVSHDLKTPLNSIISLSQQAEYTEENDLQTKYEMAFRSLIDSGKVLAVGTCRSYPPEP